MLTPKQKQEKLKSFSNENDFRQFLIDLLSKMGFREVYHTHRYGAPEQGKDIIAKLKHTLEGDEWYAFVVKYGRISGGTQEIETIKGQIKQAFEYPYTTIIGGEIKINKVKVVTNENITGGAQNQISQSPQLSIYNNFDFWWNERLIPLIDEYYSDYWLPGDEFSKAYSGAFIRKLKEEIELREMSLKKIDDKKIQKLLEIFVDPVLTVSVIEEDRQTKLRKPKNKKIHISSINKIENNILLSGEQGSGKSKILNTLACNLAHPDIIQQNHSIPVKLKAPNIKGIDFNIDLGIQTALINLGGQFYNDNIIKTYKIIPFIDDIDLIHHAEKTILIEAVKEYCLRNETHYVITFRKNEFDYDKNIETIRIQNFSSKQINQFVLKYFEGTDRGAKFIRILKESNILSKLPTTPLTITLLSLLYDENYYEIPATLTDIYNDFTAILLGKLEVRNQIDYLSFNIKRRLFSSLALKMLDNKIFEINLVDFTMHINSFLQQRGYEVQNEECILDIIDNSGVLFRDDSNLIGFKQQAFIEYFGSIEIYHHLREEYYDKLIDKFNDINWQNTAIFYAGHSKEMTKMINDVIERAPNNDLSDYFINSSGMGYLAQALYLNYPHERVKLVIKSLDILILALQEIKKYSNHRENYFYNLPMPFITTLVNFWFNENFKSITLKATLKLAFDEVFNNDNDFENNFKLLMISTTLMNSYIGDESAFTKLMDRNEFMNHPILPIVADIIIDIGNIDRKGLSLEHKKRIKKTIAKKREYLRKLLNEPAFKYNSNYFLD